MSSAIFARSHRISFYDLVLGMISRQTFCCLAIILLLPPPSRRPTRMRLTGISARSKTGGSTDPGQYLICRDARGLMQRHNDDAGQVGVANLHHEQLGSSANFMFGCPQAWPEQ